MAFIVVFSYSFESSISVSISDMLLYYSLSSYTIQVYIEMIIYLKFVDQFLPNETRHFILLALSQLSLKECILKTTGAGGFKLP